MQNLAQFKSAKYIFVIGIGGSNLASKAVWEAVSKNQKTDKKLFFLESPDQAEYDQITDFVQKVEAQVAEIAVCVISKSGETAETLTAFQKTFEMLSEKFGREINDRLIFISTPETTLYKLGQEKGALLLEWEGRIGGRFSAFTVAHTAVLELAGLEVAKFKQGNTVADQTEAERLAGEIFDHYKQGIRIVDLFLWQSELETLGKWWRQLLAESLARLTPTVSVGPTDLHSMLELYLEQPGSRYTIFLNSTQEMATSVLNKEAYENIVAEFQKRGLPFCKYEMETINEYELGRFMAFMIDITIKLGELLGLNPLDQPEVESYKSQVRKGASL